jgi:hypothetical protein
VSLFESPAASSRNVAFVTPASDQRTYVLLAQTIWVCAALYFLLFADWRTLSVDWIGRLLLLHLIWALWSWRTLAGTLLNPYVLFMLSGTLFNAGLGLVAALHLNREPILPDFPVEIVARSLLIVFASLSALHWGALFALRHQPGILAQPESSPTGDRALRLVGLGLLAISIVPLLVGLKDALSIGLTMGYSGFFQQQAAPAGVGSAIQIARDFAAPAALFLIAGSKNRRFERRAAALLLLIFCGISLFLGGRSASMLLVALAWLWDRTIARVPRTFVIGGAAILLIAVFPLVRETRNLSGEERRAVSVRTTYSELEENPAVDAVMEMGGSILPLAYSLELVPRYRPYEMGSTYYYAVLTLVPSLFWERHPSTAHGLSARLIEAVDPATADAGGAFGFSFVAEAFSNFGAIGVPLVSLLLGYGIVRLCVWTERGGDPGRFAVLATFLPYLLFFARGEASGLPRSFVWYCLAPYGAYRFLRRVLETRAS